MKIAYHVGAVNRRIMLKLILKIYNVCSDLNRPVHNSDQGWSVGEPVQWRS
jgi:hypothetical protein